MGSILNFHGGCYLNNEQKKILILFLTFILCFSFVACSDGGKKSTKSTPTPTAADKTDSEFDLTPDSKDIVVWIHSANPEDPEVNEFVIKYPDYNVDNSTSALNPFFELNYMEDIQKLGAAIASNKQPDLFLGYMEPIEAYYTNMFAPIQEYLEHDPEYNFDTIDHNALKGTTFNDKVYFVPEAFDVQCFVWNKDLFETVGLDPDKPPKTLSEFDDYNEKLVTYDTEGKIKTIGCPTLYWVHYHILTYGEHYTDETGLKLNLNTSTYNSIIEYTQSIPAVYGGNKMIEDGSISFFNGNMGMAFMTINGAQALPQWVKGRFKFGFAAQPKPDDVEEDYIASTSNNILCIPKKAKNPKGGWMYLKYRMTDGAYAKAVDFYNKTPQLCIINYITHRPTREKLYAEFEDVFTEESWELIRIRDELIQRANTTCHFLAVHTKFKLYLSDEFAKVQNDEISPKTFLENAQSYGDALLKEFKDQKTAEGWVFKDDGTVVPPEDSE